MAIVNHGAHIGANETWLATDEHHITGTFGINAGASGNPIVVTIEAGCQIYADGNHSCFYSVALGNFGSIQAVGTEASKILIQSDPTNFPNPHASDWGGFGYTGTDMIFNYQWMRIRHAGFLLQFYGANDVVDNQVNIEHVLVEGCVSVFTMNAAVPADLNGKWVNVDGLLARSMAVLGAPGIVFDFSGGAYAQTTLHNTVKNVAACTYGQMFGYNANQQLKWQMDGVISYGVGVANMLAGDTNFNAGKYVDLTLSKLFLYNGQTPAVAGQNHMLHLPAQTYQASAFRISDSVFHMAPSNGVNIHELAAPEANLVISITHCDIDSCALIGIQYETNDILGGLTLDSLYFYGNYQDFTNRTAGGAQPAHYQWYDVDNVAAPTNLQTEPVFPLDVENVVEGAPTADSITITFDAKLGSTGKRLLGVPFVEYGVVSGGPYSHSAGAHPKGTSEITEVFAKWRTDLGSFATTGHSVALSNLKAGTTYYYKPCFIDPLGRIAEGAEGTFTTLAGAGGGAKATEPGLSPLGVKQVVS